MFIFKVSWVNTSSTSPWQQSYAAGLCVVFTVAVCAKIQTATSTCIWTPWTTVLTVRVASQRSPVSLTRQRRRGFRQSSSASATLATRESAASCLICHLKPQNHLHCHLCFYWLFLCSFVKPASYTDTVDISSWFSWSEMTPADKCRF